MRRLLVSLVWLAAGLAAPPLAAGNEDGVAVIIGNRNYQGIPAVDFADRDAEAMKRYVVDLLGFDPDNVIDLDDATKGKLESAFGNERTHKGKVWRYIDPEGGSDVVVFYSGHGVPGLKDKRGYLLPVDADPEAPEINGYPVDLLYANLGKLKTRSVTVFLDTCFSGESAKGFLLDIKGGISVDPKPRQASAKLTVLTAARGNQVAGWDKGAKYGLFTNHLLDALYGKADGGRSGKGDGRVTLGEVKAYLDRHMTRAARRAFGRDQNATVLGNEGVVLASFTPGRPPERPVIGGGGAPPLPVGPSPAMVSEAQRLLEGLGFYAGGVDGVAGGRTVAAIESFQRRRGLAVDGRVTETLLALLRRQPPPPPPREPAVGTVFRDCEGARVAMAGASPAPGTFCGPEMVVIPAGSFRMGDLNGGGGNDEKPVHRVTIPRAFAVGKYEVTQAEWRALMGSNPSHFKGDRNPVESVSWIDAQDFVRRLGTKTGRQYRLLTEAEWEYATRAGTVTKWSCGNTEGCLGGVAWYAGNSGKRTHPVGQKGANGFGLYDMHGNVWEWVEDCKQSYSSTPTDGSAKTGPNSCRKRVLRGGSWLYTPWFLRSAYRDWYSTDIRYYFFGFRIARTL
jgi:formylglycine-generating enzyme required for sulfatase activity